MAIFNININNNTNVGNIEDLKILYGSVDIIPSTLLEYNNLTEIDVNNIINFNLSTTNKKHVFIIPIDLNIEKIINKNNLNELITNEYVLHNSNINLDNNIYKLFKLENDALYLNTTIHSIYLSNG